MLWFGGGGDGSVAGVMVGANAEQDGTTIINPMALNPSEFQPGVVGQGLPRLHSTHLPVPAELVPVIPMVAP